jgi:RimJ/RimL family protein N-acetyltransferase
MTAVRGELSTDRLRLRPWRRDDDAALAAIFAKPEVWQYPLRRGMSKDEAARFLARRLQEFDDQGWTLWAAELKQTGTLIGYVGLAEPTFLPEIMPSVEVGYRLDPDHWGHGLATEGAEAAIDFGFDELGLEHVVSIAEPDNLRSLNVMARLGMTLDRDAVHPELGMPLKVYRVDKASWRVRRSRS